MTTSASPLVIAFIPARAGSKGVPRKNARLLGNIPLLGYTVGMAVRTKGIDRVVVSTEDHELAAITRYYGGEVPFMRPDHLARDDSSLNDVINHTHAQLKTIWHFPERYILVTMMPTSPFRNLQEMEFLIEKARSCFHVSTVSTIRHSRDSLYSMWDDGLLQPLLPDQWGKKNFYRLNGYCLATSWGSPPPAANYVHQVQDPISRIDIDHWEDFFLAEEVLRCNLFDFGMEFRP